MNILDVDIKYKVGNFKGFYRFGITDVVTGIWGASGHGKTTLIQLLSGLLKPIEGTISILGEEVVNQHKGFCLPAHKRNIGVVFQEARLFPHMTVRKNLQYGIQTQNEVRIVFDDVVEVLGLASLLDHMPSQCSGGEQQRVAIGRALLSQPKLLLLDEPFSALDIKLKIKTIRFIRKAIQRFSIPVVIISHDISDILKLTNRMLLIKKGKVEAVGDFTKLLMQGYFEGVPFSDSFVNDLKFTVIAKDEANNYRMRLRGSECNYFLYSEHSRLKVGDQVEAFLRPEDITISIQRIQGISMQNQLEAIVTDVYIDKNYALCLLDVGTELVVQITKDSVTRLGLEKDMKVYALFKSAALAMYDDSLQMAIRL